MKRANRRITMTNSHESGRIQFDPQESQLVVVHWNELFEGVPRGHSRSTRCRFEDSLTKVQFMDISCWSLSQTIGGDVVVGVVVVGACASVLWSLLVLWSLALLLSLLNINQCKSRRRLYYHISPNTTIALVKKRATTWVCSYSRKRSNWGPTSVLLPSNPKISICPLIKN